MTKTMLVLAIAVAFLAGSLVTSSIAFGDADLTKLQKKCSKEPKGSHDDSHDAAANDAQIDNDDLPANGENSNTIQNEN